MKLLITILSLYLVTMPIYANELESEECLLSVDANANTLITDVQAITNAASKCTPAQIKEFKSIMQKYHGSVDMNSCLPKQKTIIGNYSYQLKVQINKLINGIAYEERKGTDPAIIKEYKKLLSELVARSAYTHDLYQQISKVDSKNMCKPFAFAENPVGEKAFKEALNKASEIAEAYEFSGVVTDKLKEELIKETFKVAAGETLKFAKQAISTSTLKAVFRISAAGVTREIVAGAVKGAVVDLLMKPLYGSKVPEEYEWKEAMTEDVSLLLNPQWMNEAGIRVPYPDSQWATHCRALEKYPDEISKLTSKFTMKPARDFKIKVLEILNAADLKKKEARENEFNVPVGDETIREKQTIKEAIALPLWAQ